MSENVTMTPEVLSPEARSRRKERIGKVVSDKMQKTVVVEQVRQVAHPKYKKYMKITKKYHVHNAGNKAKTGETVTIRSCRPLSKTKSFEIIFT